VKAAHEAHPSHGYRWIHAFLLRENGITVSPEYIRQAFRFLGIESKTKHKARITPRKAREPYPNLIFSTWETVDRPRQVIVSDMCTFWTRFRYYELVLYVDVFTKQILGHGLTDKRGLPKIYYDGLHQALSQLEDTIDEPVVFHTDQGSVYTSMDYNRIIKERHLVRSCSRVGKPTDNPVSESLNGWIKEELFLDFGLYDADDVAATVVEYIKFYNSRRPSYSLGYDTPDNYYRRFMVGEIERKDTFKDRILDETPKFLRHNSITDEGGVSTYFDEEFAIPSHMSTSENAIQAILSTF